MVSKQVFRFSLTFFLACLLSNSVVRGEGSDRLFWSSLYGSIQSSEFDGTDRRFFAGVTWQSRSPQGIAIDSSNDHFYWVSASSESIWRSRLDGSDAELLIQADRETEPLQIDYDPINDKLYWTTDDSGDVVRANADGSDIEIVVDGPDFTTDWRDIVVDPIGGIIYWVDFREKAIRLASTNSSHQAVLHELDNYAVDLAIDHVNQKLYWSLSGIPRVQRSNFDGSDLETVLSLANDGFEDVAQIAVDPQESKIYWSEIDTRSIKRANLDGSFVETLVTAGADILIDLALAKDLYPLSPVATGQSVQVPEPSSLVLVVVTLMSAIGSHRVLVI